MVIHNPANDEFEELISTGKTLVDFWASWCGPCRAQSPIAEELAETTDVKLIKINVDEDCEVTPRFGITSIPTLLLFDGGELIGKFIGLTALDELKKAFKV